jgi:hypothetical protein
MMFDWGQQTPRRDVSKNELWLKTSRRTVIGRRKLAIQVFLKPLSYHTVDPSSGPTN